MDRGAWQATVHRVTKSRTEATEHAHMNELQAFFILRGT